MTQSFIATFGLYGGTLVIAFVAGVFPLVSIEIFLAGVTAVRGATAGELVALIALAALGHQIAKTLCYIGGAGILERPAVKRRVAKIQPTLDRWDKYPKLVMAIAATIGLPPLWALAFVARPLMHIRFGVFTGICLTGRVARYAFVALVPLVFDWHPFA